jgi:hypothetical protein
MPIRTGEAAPYAPPATVLQVINSLRDRGLTTPITSDVLLRAGISESLVPRTLRSLIGLELIGDDGYLTPAMESLRRAASSEFKARLAEHVRAVYEEVFQFTDPAKDDSKRIADAFRVYEPIGQRGRMVTLFLGLCEAAGIIPEGVARRSPTPSNGVTRKAAPPKRQNDRGKDSPPPFGVTGASGTRSPVIEGVLSMLPVPGQGWSKTERDRWMNFFEQALDFAIPVRDVQPESDADDLDDES